MTIFTLSASKKSTKNLTGDSRNLLTKKILKIVENPQLGKPLHAPLQNYRSERVEKLRIVYSLKGKTIKFAWIDDRGHVYG